jgi:hypothetical protein
MVNMNDQLLLLKKFPLIVPQNREFTLYRGFIQVGVSMESDNRLLAITKKCVTQNKSSHW